MGRISFDVKLIFFNQIFPVKKIPQYTKKLVQDHNPMSPSLFAKKIEQIIAS